MVFLFVHSALFVAPYVAARPLSAKSCKHDEPLAQTRASANNKIAIVAHRPFQVGVRVSMTVQTARNAQEECEKFEDREQGQEMTAASAAGAATPSAREHLWMKYPKMAESTKAWATLPAGAWVVTEKIHGANFSVVADGCGTRFAKRSGELPEHEDFYSFRSAGLNNTLSACAQRLLDALRRTDGVAVDSVCIFGELCGGHYPHPEVAPAPGTAPVQRGVWYSPSLVFVAFDVCVCEQGAADGRFLDFAEARRLALAAGFHFVEALAQGSLQACLDVPVRFSSHVPAMLGLPSLASLGTPNLAEGVVVRMASEVKGSKPGAGPKGKGPALAQRGHARAMFKRKIAEFSEKQYQNSGWKEAKAGGGSSGPSGEELLRLEMLAAVTEQRVAAVASKVGRPNLDRQADRQADAQTDRQRQVLTRRHACVCVCVCVCVRACMRVRSVYTCVQFHVSIV